MIIRVLYVIIIKSEVWTICHCLGLGHETMVYALRVFLYYLLLIQNEENYFRMTKNGVKSLSRRGAYVHQWSGSTIVPLPEPMLTNCWLGALGTKFSEIWIKIRKLQYENETCECRLQNVEHLSRLQCVISDGNLSQAISGTKTSRSAFW